jgi:hypothetical protein
VFRYVLDMRVSPEQKIAPGAAASDRGGDHVSFSLPPESLDIPTLFEQVRSQWHVSVRSASHRMVVAFNDSPPVVPALCRLLDVVHCWTQSATC